MTRPFRCIAFAIALTGEVMLSSCEQHGPGANPSSATAQSLVTRQPQDASAAAVSTKAAVAQATGDVVVNANNGQSPVNDATKQPTVVTRIEVRQDSTQTGIPAKIVKIAVNDTSEYFAQTDDTGVVTPHKSCGPDDRISAEPVIPNFLKIPPKPCAGVLVFTASSAQTAYALAVLGSDAMKAGEYKLAQAYYSSASEKVSATRPGDALVFKNQAYIAVGKSLGISKPTVNVNGEEVPTHALQREIEKIQEQHQILPTGTLNTKTALTFDAIDENELLRQSSKVNPALLERERIDTVKSQLGIPTSADVAAASGVPRYDLNKLITIEKGPPAIRIDGRRVD